MEKIKALLKKWVEGDFKTDPQLNLIPSLYNKLKSEGHDFSSVSDTVSYSAAIMLLHLFNWLWRCKSFTAIKSFSVKLNIELQVQTELYYLNVR